VKKSRQRLPDGFYDASDGSLGDLVDALCNPDEALHGTSFSTHRLNPRLAT